MEIHPLRGLGFERDLGADGVVAEEEREELLKRVVHAIQSGDCLKSSRVHLREGNTDTTVYP